MTEAIKTALQVYHNTPVLEFHQVFGHPVNSKPAVPTISDRILRVKLIAEELVELAQASGVSLFIDSLGAGEYNDYQLTVGEAVDYDGDTVEFCDLVEVADALGDLRYVVDGANLVYGISGQAVLDEIHTSNMSKLGEDGKPIYREDGKILKGPNYFKPDITRAILEAVGMHIDMEKAEEADRTGFSSGDTATGEHLNRD